MHAVRRTAALLSAALLGAGLLSTPSGAAVTAPPTVELEPARLTRGPDIAVPHVEGDDLVVGERRVDLPGARALYLGADGPAHLVGTSTLEGRRNRVLRVEPDGTITLLLRGVSPYEVVVSDDGARLAAVARDAGRSTVSAWSSRTGDRVGHGRLPDHPHVLAVERGRVLVSTWERGVFWYWTGNGRTRAVTSRPGASASIAHDLLATYTGDPYQGGCVLLTRLSRPGRTLWRSCRERVDGFSPDGARIATVHILADGLGPNEVMLREIDGTRLATYRTRWFGAVSWESPTAMLLETHGERRTAVVRCVLAACENATDPERTVDSGPVSRPLS